MSALSSTWPVQWMYKCILMLYFAVFASYASGTATGASVGEPRKLYYVQVATTDSAVEALKLKAELTKVADLEWLVIEANNLYKLRVGPVRDYPEALLVRNWLRRLKYSDSFIVSLPNQNREKVPMLSADAILQVTNGKKMTSSAVRWWEETAYDDAIVSAGSALSEGNGSFLGGIDWDKTVEHSVGDPEYGKTMFHRALSMERHAFSNGSAVTERDRILSDIITTLGLLADMKIPAPTGYQTAAALQIGHILHYSMNRSDLAYAQYMKLYHGATQECAEMRANLAVQICATYIEMMDSGGKGSPQDTRMAIQEYITMTDPRYIKQLARMELMLSEVYFWEGKSALPQAIIESQTIADKYRAICNVVSDQAQYNYAIACLRSGDDSQFEYAMGKLALQSTAVFENRLKPERSIRSFAQQSLREWRARKNSMSNSVIQESVGQVADAGANASDVNVNKLPQQKSILRYEDLVDAQIVESHVR